MDSNIIENEINILEQVLLIFERNQDINKVVRVLKGMIEQRENLISKGYLNQGRWNNENKKK